MVVEYHGETREERPLVALDQHRAPLFEAVCEYARKVKAPLHVPGHKMGKGTDREWATFLGSKALSIDLTEAPGLDDLHAPMGVIAEAEALAAEAFGARETHFLVGGSTAGLHGLMLASTLSGGKVAVPRNAHRSVLGAMILSGTKPIWVPVRFHEDLDLAIGHDPNALASCLGEASAVVLVHPTYFGTTSGLSEGIAAAHRQNLPVLVDESHGSHFAFHPALPPSALSLGADATVQSIHKTGGSLTQSSMCHLGQQTRVDRSRVREMLQLVQSTSPSYLLMASLDMARRYLAVNGRDVWSRTIDLATQVKHTLGAMKGIRVLDIDDPSKLVIDVRRRQITGFQAADHLWSQGVATEMSGLGYVVAVLSPGDSEETFARLIAGVGGLPSGTRGVSRPPDPPWPEVVTTPREAYLGRKRAISLAKSIGRVAAELVVPYPPGIPVVAPGERLTVEVLEYLRHAVRSGYRLQGPSDLTLTTIQVMEE